MIRYQYYFWTFHQQPPKLPDCMQYLINEGYFIIGGCKKYQNTYNICWKFTHNLLASTRPRVLTFATWHDH